MAINRKISNERAIKRLSDISEVGPGQRSHPPHRHGGDEAFSMLEGEGTLELDEEWHLLCANEAIVFDPQKLHGLVNHSNTPMKYMVILAD